MTLARRIAPLAVTALTSARTRSLRRALFELGRRARGAPRRVHYFHQVDDPYSQLAAHLLPALVERYEISLVPHLVDPPPDAAAPERARLAAFARRDAADVAAGYGLAFPASAAEPAPGAVALATRVLARAIEHLSFGEVAASVGEALWSGDESALRAIAERAGAASEDAARAARAAGTALRERRGHYLGAMFLYGGEWYWGVDRLHHLERRLAGERARRAGAAPVAPRPEVRDDAAASSGPRLTLDFFASLRSPYTYIAMERVRMLAEHYGVELVLRPVLPIVERAGLAGGEARAHLDRPGWRDELERNRQVLLELGLWGVPSFRLGGGSLPPYSTWGQDRLWRLEQEILRRQSASRGATVTAP